MSVAKQYFKHNLARASFRLVTFPERHIIRKLNVKIFCFSNALQRMAFYLMMVG